MALCYVRRSVLQLKTLLEITVNMVKIAKDPFILHRNCVAVPIHAIYRLLSAASHRGITAFQVKMSLTFMRHSNAVTLQFLCRKVQCGNATQLRRSMNRPNSI